MPAWCLENSYPDLVDLMDEADASIAAKGKKSRRNWWDTFAGGENGKPSVRKGIEFPVLRAAQIRQGKPITPNAICRNQDEEVPSVVATKRWPRRRLPSKARRIAKDTRRQSANARASSRQPQRPTPSALPLPDDPAAISPTGDRAAG